MKLILNCRHSYRESTSVHVESIPGHIKSTPVHIKITPVHIKITPVHIKSTHVHIDLIIGAKRHVHSSIHLNQCLLVFQPFVVSAFEKRLMKEIELREGRYQPPVMPASDTEAFEESVPLMQCKPPRFDQKLSDFQLMEGSDATFVCKVSGNPKPKVSVMVCCILLNWNTDLHGVFFLLLILLCFWMTFVN